MLKEVESSDWATPIVPVLKPNGTVRSFGDFKLTLNQYLDTPECPMPTLPGRAVYQAQYGRNVYEVRPKLCISTGSS